MREGSVRPGTALAPVPVFGPLDRLSRQVHELANSGRCEQALTAADAYEPVARLLGDELTVDFLIQGRMYAQLELGRVGEGIAAGQDLLVRQRASGNLLGEAKVLADLSSALLLGGRVADGLGHLARAGLLLEQTTRRNNRYFSALGSYAEAARVGGLYETANGALAELIAHDAIHDPGAGSYHEQIYLTLLLTWGLRLDQLGHTIEGGTRLRRVLAVASDWLARHRGSDTAGESREFVAAQALALAKLGDADRAIALAETVVLPLHDCGPFWWASTAHLALGIALAARGDLDAARRELLEAHRHLRAQGCSPEEQLIVQHELAALAVRTHGLDACGDLIDLVRSQNLLLWRQRLQQLAMLRQARQHEELEVEHTRAQADLLRDPLTRVGNRRLFDQIMAALDEGTVPGPVSLLVIDVDKFKAVNDTYSHSAGDGVLRQLGIIIGSQCRSGQDTAIRYAGDEFIVVLNSDPPGSLEIAERIRAAVANADFDHITPGTPITVSIGVATWRPGMKAVELFHAADSHLYAAKRAGRDRVGS